MSSTPTPETAARHARDAELIRRVRAGDAGALDEIVRVYADALTQAARMITGSSDLAQDAAQEVLCWLWDARGTLDIRGSVLAYLVRAARNRATSVMRREQAQQQVATQVIAMRDAAVPDDPEPSERDVAHAEFYAALEEALAQLRPRMREIFLLHADLGMSYAEIEETLGIGRATIHNQMSLAIKTLRPLMERWRRV